MVSAQTAGPLGPFQWKNRPLLVFAPSAEHPLVREQLARVDAERAGFRERDMVLLRIPPHGEGRADGEALSAVDVDALRAEFGIEPDEFAAILVGKDGTEKQRWMRPAEMVAVFRLIDGMPMRREEMKQKPAGGS